MDNKLQTSFLPWLPMGKDIFKIILIGLAYFIAHQIGFLFPDSENVLAAVWPAGGLGLAALLLNPRRLWPAIIGVRISIAL